MGTWSSLHPGRILHAPAAISGFSTGESRTWALRSGAEYSTDMGIAAPKFSEGQIH